jgi:3-hydroxyacyl-[acyl-carrier-protein] dehydratase
VRFLFVDRVVALESGRRIETVKNVTSSEDVFADHFPGYPVLPGALMVETFEQAAQLLIAATHAFTRLGRLERLSRASFRQAVRPGDQLRVRCERRGVAEDTWTIAAAADVDGQRVAAATLDFSLAGVDDAETRARADRLREMLRVAQPGALALGGGGE